MYSPFALSNAARMKALSIDKKHYSKTFRKFFCSTRWKRLTLPYPDVLAQRLAVFCCLGDPELEREDRFTIVTWNKTFEDSLDLAALSIVPKELCPRPSAFRITTALRNKKDWATLEGADYQAQELSYGEARQHLPDFLVSAFEQQIEAERARGASKLFEARRRAQQRDRKKYAQPEIFQLRSQLKLLQAELKQARRQGSTSEAGAAETEHHMSVVKLRLRLLECLVRGDRPEHAKDVLVARVEEALSVPVFSRFALDRCTQVVLGAAALTKDAKSAYLQRALTRRLHCLERSRRFDERKKKEYADVAYELNSMLVSQGKKPYKALFSLPSTMALRFARRSHLADVDPAEFFPAPRNSRDK